jgi:hypothetical protein
MNQLLYVEGKDYFFIGSLCRKHFPPPKGLDAKKGKDNFLKGGGGYTQTLDKFIEAFNTPDLTNIGLIVDADFRKIEGRFAEIMAALSKKLNRDLSKYTLNTEGLTIVEEGLPAIGIWIMPDNTNNGYLEYFVEQLIDDNDDILPIVKSMIDDLMQKDYCRFTDFKKQKAIIYTWLAWQETPGLPFGTALDAKYLNPNKEALKPFLNWIEQTFQF